MNKVTTINLNGQAIQLEEVAYKKLHDYLEKARHELRSDPDQAEIMQDFEQAIADKCNDLLKGNKNVISLPEITTIIEAMGEVEVADTSKVSDDAKNSEETDADHPSNSIPKRLYTLRDGAILGGVCSGLAAYLNVDVTIVRLIFVILVFITSGLAVLIYFLMMLILPEATTPEQKAELRGERFTAQSIIDKAKQKYAYLGQREHWEHIEETAAPTLTKAGKVTRKIISLIFGATSIVLSVTMAIITCVWVAAIVWLLSGHLHLSDQLRTIPFWAVLTATTAIYMLVILPIIVLAVAFNRVAYSKHFQRRDGRRLAAIVVLWMIAMSVLCGLGGAYHTNFSDYEQTHGYIQINGHQVCINQRLCSHDHDIHQPGYPIPDRPDMIDLPAAHI